jgi:hypothetical protein
MHLVRGIHKNRHAGRRRKCLFEYLELLRCERLPLDARQFGDVPAWLSKAGDQAQPHGVRRADEHDGDPRGDSRGNARCALPHRQQVHLLLDEVPSGEGQLVIPSYQKPEQLSYPRVISSRRAARLKRTGVPTMGVAMLDQSAPHVTPRKERGAASGVPEVDSVHSNLRRAQP